MYILNDWRQELAEGDIDKFRDLNNPYPDKEVHYTHPYVISKDMFVMTNQANFVQHQFPVPLYEVNYPSFD